MTRESPDPREILQTAQSALRLGFAPVVVRAGDKRAILPRWEDITYTEETLVPAFTGSFNVGLRWGLMTDGRYLVDCDFESPEAVQAAAWLLPETAMRWGREGHPNSHWVYQTDVPLKKNKSKFYGPKRTLICELRGKDQQSVCPPSTSPKGGSYTWAGVPFGTPSEVKVEELERLLRAVSLVVVTAPVWNDVGGRHDAALALAGFLLKQGFTQEEATGVMQGIVTLADDDEGPDRLNCVASTFATFSDGGEVLGASALEALFDIDYFKWIINLFRVRLSAEERVAGDDRYFNDLGNARWLAELEGEDMVYISDWNRWGVWQGTHWDARVQSLEYRRRIHRTLTAMRQFAKTLSSQKATAMLAHILTSENSRQIEAMGKEAQAILEHRSNEFDQDNWLLNVANGTIDLRTGRFTEHRREDYMTKLARPAYDPEATCPLWLAFLERIFEGDKDLIAYIQRVTGYCLTGCTSEQIFFFLYGTGKNGKSTYIETIAALLNDYAVKTPVETLIAKKEVGNGNGNGLAQLPGARFVSAREMEAGRWLAEGIVKDLTGQDKITAKMLYGEPFEFTPTHKLLMYGNHKPMVKGADEGIWRRIRLIPFLVTIPEEERDKLLGEKLLKELPGILNWALAGCQDWKERGIGEPGAVTLATDEYREEMDSVAEFIDSHFLKDANSQVTMTSVYGAYVAWCDATGEAHISQRVLSNRLIERRYQRIKKNGGVYWKGLREIRNQ